MHTYNYLGFSTGYSTVYVVHLVVTLIWGFGDVDENRQIKITANLAAADSPNLNVSQLLFAPKSPNLMSAKCTTRTVYCKLLEVKKFCGWTRYF